MKKKTAGPTIRSQIPALDSYLTRINAEELNFRRFMVKQYVKGGNYYIEKTLIKIMPDGTISCSGLEGNEPTDEERKAITEAIKDFPFPKSVGASLRAAEKQADIIGGETYLFSRRSDKTIVMIQQKWIKPDGTKVYPCWSLWSDGLWRMMEPDGPLPFWKPINVKGTPSGLKMIHEGAKAAKHITELLEDKKALAKHPWGKELELYEHWGMIGGALAPQRSDYDELRSEKPTEVVYVCDNDRPGEKALEKVSECYGDHLKGIKFGDNFKPSWDMADPMPEKMFSKDRYIGSPLSYFIEPATWGSIFVPTPGSKKKTARLLDAFVDEWVHIVQPEFYLHREWPWIKYSPDEFNNRVRPYTPRVDNTAKLLQTYGASKVAALKYDPSRDPGVYENSEGRYVNTYMPSAIKPLKGDETPFLEFMQQLLPEEEDRTEVMRWCATLIDKPAIKMLYGVLLISDTQGVGKSTLGEKILAPLVGMENTSFPSEDSVVKREFNGWVAHRRLAVVHEIYAGHSTAAYYKLKQTITERMVPVNRKYVDEYNIENWLHVFACSNSMKALKLDDEDRRWYFPRITDIKKPLEYWVEFNDWLRNKGGLQIIRWWASEFLKDHEPVQEGTEAPWSRIKDKVIHEGYSDGQNLVITVFGRVDHILKSDDPDDLRIREDWETKAMLRDGNVILTDLSLRSLIKTKLYDGRQNDRLERPATIRKMAKAAGWHVGEKRVPPGMVNWGPDQANAQVISNCPKIASTSPTDLGGRRADPPMMPLDLSFMKTM